MGRVLGLFLVVFATQPVWAMSPPAAYDRLIVRLRGVPPRVTRGGNFEAELSITNEGKTELRFDLRCGSYVSLATDVPGITPTHIPNDFQCAKSKAFLPFVLVPGRESIHTVPFHVSKRMTPTKYYLTVRLRVRNALFVQSLPVELDVET